MTKFCVACGMPMLKPDDFANSDTTLDFCVHCVKEDGTMQSFEEKLHSMVETIVRAQKINKGMATDLALARMSGLPAWKDREEFRETAGADA